MPTCRSIQAVLSPTAHRELLSRAFRLWEASPDRVVGWTALDLVLQHSSSTSGSQSAIIDPKLQAHRILFCHSGANPRPVGHCGRGTRTCCQ